MSCPKELDQIARDLINGGSRWFKGNRQYFTVLRAFIRDKGVCVYCGKDLWEKFGVASCGDHLLPKSGYPDRAEDVDNRVAACAECNHIKRNFDPSGNKVVERPITDEVRLELIRKAGEEINKRRRDSGWEGEFQTAKRQFQEAVAKYRDCGGC
jgi:hypothetical protein